jgi:outer membrane receptor for monomeric catechols
MKSLELRKMGLFLTVVLVGLVGASAGEGIKKAKTAKSSTTTQDRSGIQAEKNIELTGSRIRRDVRRNGLITDGPHNVIVIDRATIDRSGASDLRQALAIQGIR